MSPIRHPLLSVLGVSPARGGTGGAVAAPGQPQAEAALRSLSGRWYDAKSRSYVPPQLTEPRDHPLRTSGRLAAPVPQWNWNWTRPRLFDWLPNALLFVLIALLVAGATWLAFRSAGSFPKREPRPDTSVLALDLVRVEELPFLSQVPLGDPLAEARRLALAGRYEQAIVYLYGYLLLVLDHARRIHLQRGKTNRMYLSELSGFPELRGTMESMMLLFERVFFGKQPASQADFRAWSQVSQVHGICTANARRPSVWATLVHGGRLMAHRRLDPGIAARALRILAATTLALSSGPGLYAYQQFAAVVGKEQYRDRNGMGVHRRMWGRSRPG